MAKIITAGIVAGPCYVAVSLAEALTRDGFDPTRHAWSLLANGDWGWLHIANLIGSGLLTVAGAVGLHRAGVGKWGPRLLAVYGFSLVAAGIFRADPAQGFPPGTPGTRATTGAPEGTDAVSWHGTLHFLAGAIGFVALAAACFALARRFAADDHRGWAMFSRVTGVLFLASFVALAAGGGSSATILAFTGAVVLASGWLSAISIHYHDK